MGLVSCDQEAEGSPADRAASEIELAAGMSLEDDMEVLRQVPLFGQLDRDQLRLLAFGAEHRFLKAGEILFRAEARADAGFVVVRGEVELLEGEGASQRVVALAGRGSLLGEMALMAETRRPTTAVTRSECDLIRVPRPLFRRMLLEYPQIAAALHERIRDDLLAMTAAVAALGPVFDEDDEKG